MLLLPIVQFKDVTFDKDNRISYPQKNIARRGILGKDKTNNPFTRPKKEVAALNYVPSIAKSNCELGGSLAPQIYRLKNNPPRIFIR